MNPQDQFKDRYQKYISERNQTINEPSLQSPTRKTFGPNKFYVLGIFVGILLILPVTYLYLANQMKQSSVPQVAEMPIGITNTQIDSELKTIWGPYYESAKNDLKLREAAKKNIELKNAAVNAGVTTSSKIASDETMSSYSEEQLKLRQDLTEKVVTLRKINGLTTFIGLIPNNQTAYNSTIQRAKTSMEAIRSLMLEKGLSLPQAFDEIKKTGGYYTKFNMQENITVTNASRWDQPFLGKIMSSKNNEISAVIQSYGSLLLFQVLDAQDTPYKTVEEYLKSK